MASPPRPAKIRARAPAPAAESDDVLRQIFLLLDSPADLARACAASPAFRRVITDPRFLRCFRARHPPPLLGIVSSVFLPAEPPHPSAPAARELFHAGDIDFSSLSFLPSPGPWYFSDSRDGRMLHIGGYQWIGCCTSHRSLHKPIVVSDPLHRRYLVLPAIPEDLAALVSHGEYIHYFKPILAPAAHDEQDASFSARSLVDEDDEYVSPTPSFRVLYMVQSAGKLFLFVFSSCGVVGGRQWRAFEFEGWNALGKELDDAHVPVLRHHYAHGRFYWTIYPGSKKILVIDSPGSTPEFSFMDFPSHAGKNSVMFVEAAGEHEKLAMVTICRHSKEHHVYHLRYEVQREDNGGDDKWKPEAIIYLPRFHGYSFVGVAGGYLLLEGMPDGWYDYDFGKPRPNIACFSLDLRTLQLDWFCESKYTFIDVNFYCGCPPYLSPLTV